MPAFVKAFGVFKLISQYISCWCFYHKHLFLLISVEDSIPQGHMDPIISVLVTNVSSFWKALDRKKKKKCFFFFFSLTRTFSLLKWNSKPQDVLWRSNTHHKEADMLLVCPSRADMNRNFNPLKKSNSCHSCPVSGTVTELWREHLSNVNLKCPLKSLTLWPPRGVG